MIHRVIGQSKSKNLLTYLSAAEVKFAEIVRSSRILKDWRQRDSSDLREKAQAHFLQLPTMLGYSSKPLIGKSLGETTTDV